MCCSLSKTAWAKRRNDRALHLKVARPLFPAAPEPGSWCKTMRELSATPAEAYVRPSPSQNPRQVRLTLLG